MPYAPHFLPQSDQSRLQQELRGADFPLSESEPTYVGGVCDVPLAFDLARHVRAREVADHRLAAIVRALQAFGGW